MSVYHIGVLQEHQLSGSFMSPSSIIVSLTEKKSRLLRVVPLTGYGYESKSVSSTPIEITEFSRILIEIRGLDGEYVKFPRGSKTIVNLRITK